MPTIECVHYRGDKMTFLNTVWPLVWVSVFYFQGAAKVDDNNDFFYFDLSDKWKRILYIRGVPVGRVSLISIAIRSWSLVTLLIQVVVFFGIGYLNPLIVVVFFFLPGLFIIALYMFACMLFAPKWIKDILPNACYHIVNEKHAWHLLGIARFLRLASIQQMQHMALKDGTRTERSDGNIHVSYIYKGRTVEMIIRNIGEDNIRIINAWVKAV